MREHRRSGKWLLLAMGVAALIAAIFWMYAVSGFSLAYGFCEGAFALDAKFVRCQTPVVFLLLFWGSVGAGVSLGAMALYLWVCGRHG
ncbi:hypothetical protein ACVWWJ_003917 [Luteibacter sp. HA06]